MANAATNAVSRPISVLSVVDGMAIWTRLSTASWVKIRPTCALTVATLAES